MKNYILILCYLFFSIFNTSCSQSKQTDLKIKSLSQLLNTIDQNQDINSLKKILDDSIMVYIPDAPIIYSKEVVLNLFKYSWGRNEVNTNINYKPYSIKEHNNEIIEEGMYSYKDGNGEKIEMPYRMVGVKINNKLLMKELVYANSKKELPVLPKPTGKYNIGQSIYYRDKNNQNNRPLAFQIWYPTIEDANDKISFHSKNEAEAISSFLGWPLFNNSFTRLMKSHSIKGVPIVPNKKFPVVIYNHGYGGATPVYQTVFEELASHGYIVVSVGHQDESAFLIKEDGSVIQNSPQNEFYVKRQPELNNRIIGAEQSTLLNSDNLLELSKAYRKLVQLSPLHTESVNLWAFDTKRVIHELKKINQYNIFLKDGFDFNNMGIFGHSVGGATAGELSSTTMFKAGINIDGFQFGNLINTNLKTPFMFISSNEEGNNYLRVSPFAQTSEKDTYQSIIKGFSHGSFSDLQLFSPNGVRDIQLQRQVILGFFNKYLKNENINFQGVSYQFDNLIINKLK